MATQSSELSTPVAKRHVLPQREVYAVFAVRSSSPPSRTSFPFSFTATSRFARFPSLKNTPEKQVPPVMA